VTVSQTHLGIGGWRLALRYGGATDDFVARINPWDHVLITPRGLGPQPNLASIKATAVFSGRLDEVDIDGGTVTIGGPSTAVWMGDEAGRGRFPDQGQAATTTLIYGGLGWFDYIFNASGSNLNGLTLGKWQNLQTGNFTWEFERFATVRQRLDELSALCDRPFEWIVLPSGEIQIEGWVPSGRSGNGAADSGANSAIDYTNTIFTYLPEVLLGDGLERTDGVSAWANPTTQRPLQVFPAEVGVNWDFSLHAARGISRGSDGTVRSTGTQKNTYETNGYGFDPSVRIGWDTIVDYDTTDTTLLQSAANQVGRLASIRREWSVVGGSSELVGFVKAGDYVWVHSDRLPGVASMTYADEAEAWAGVGASSDPAVYRVPQAANVNVGGRNLYPVRGRVQAIEWPVSDRFDVWLARTWDGSGDVELLNPLVDFDPEGPCTIDINASRPRWQMQRKVFGSTISRAVNLQANSPDVRS
jgi:hypothetical protein